jgi:hypothetical protein
MAADVRDKHRLSHQDVVALNFIRRPCPVLFRSHFRQGLRSHVMEVLTPEDVKREQGGIETDGVRKFPQARPLKMLRIFRSRFRTLTDALEEIRRLRIIETYLPPDLIARSEEFLVDYRPGAHKDVLLCGLQEYVAGNILDPWALGQCRIAADGPVGRSAARFVGAVKRMVLEAGFIPDLAGVGNLMVTPAGEIKLVDINNISRLREPQICIDDQGYPACDKSIEALALLERHLLGSKPEELRQPPYQCLLDPDRSAEVKRLERKFMERLKRSEPAGKLKGQEAWRPKKQESD